MTRQEQIKDVTESSVECNEHKETAVTSVKQSILKETSTEATGKMNCDLGTTSGDNKSNSLVDDLNNSKSDLARRKGLSLTQQLKRKHFQLFQTVF
jgi:hypothetical protein